MQIKLSQSWVTTSPVQVNTPCRPGGNTAALTQRRFPAQLPRGGKSLSQLPQKERRPSALSKKKCKCPKLPLLGPGWALGVPAPCGQREQRTQRYPEDLRPLGHGDWRGLDFLSLKSFLFLPCLRTNITVTYVSQFMQLISYTFDSSILFSAVLNFSSLWEVERVYPPLPHLATPTPTGQVALSGGPWDEPGPQLYLLPTGPEGTRQRLRNLQTTQILRG